MKCKLLLEKTYGYFTKKPYVQLAISDNDLLYMRVWGSKRQGEGWSPWTMIDLNIMNWDKVDETSVRLPDGSAENNPGGINSKLGEALGLIATLK